MKKIIGTLSNVVKNSKPQFNYLIQKGSDRGSFALNRINGSKTEQIKGAINEMLLHKDVVKKLSLCFEELDYKAAEILADFLATNPSLQTLDLLENNIGDKGAIAIAQALKTNKNLQDINLRSNLIGHDGAKKIAEMLCVNKGLKTIFLEEYSIPHNCESEFIEAIKQNTSLEHAFLDFNENNKYGIQIDELIKNALAENAKLQFVTGCEYRMGGKAITNDNPIHLSDAIRDYSAILIARIIREIASYDSKHNFVDTLPNIESQAIKESDKILMNGLTNSEMLAFSKQWHSPFHQITSQKLRDYGVEWPALFGKKEIAIPSSITGEDGWKLITLTNPKELKLEGQNLKHCVGSYTSKCINRNSHIISVVNNKGNAVSTIEFALKKDGSLIKKKHYGKSNSQCCLQSQMAENWICAEVKNGNTKINHECLKTNEDEIPEKRKQNLFIDQLGFNPLDDSKFSELIRVYKRQMLPSGKFEIPNLTKNFRENFLGKIELSFDPGMELYEMGKISKITLDSIIEKPKITVENKILSGIQGSTNKIYGKDVVQVSLTNNQIFFSTKNSEALEEIKKIFEGKFLEKEDGILIKEDLNLQSVRQIMTSKALQVRKEKRQTENDKPNTAVRNPNLTNDIENNSRGIS